jgi:hypothetical protein
VLELCQLGIVGLQLMKSVCDFWLCEIMKDACLDKMDNKQKEHNIYNNGEQLLKSAIIQS